MADPLSAERASSTEIIDANKLTMQQALELFELLQARKSKESEKSVTVEAEPVARTPARAEIGTKCHLSKRNRKKKYR